MPLFEVKVRRTSTVYFEVEAKNKAQAEGKYDKVGVLAGEVIEDEYIQGTTPLLTDDDDEPEDYVYNEEDWGSYDE